jgi:hypothetical protein
MTAAIPNLGVEDEAEAYSLNLFVDFKVLNGCVGCVEFHAEHAYQQMVLMKSG